MSIQFHVFSQTIIYVNDAATGANDGTSWANAYTNLVDACSSAPAYAEVWIAQTNNEGYVVTKNNNRSAHIEISKPLTFVGGFKGTETLKSEIGIGYHSTVSGEIGSNTDLIDNTNTAFRIKSTHVVFEGIIFKKFNALHIEDVVTEYGAIIADTNAIVDIKNCLFIKNNGTTNGTCISAFKDSKVTISESSFVENVQFSYGSIISRKDGSTIRIRDAIFSNNGSSNAGYILYNTSKFFGNESINLQDEVLLDLNRVKFSNNQMPISYSYEGSANFTNCSFDLIKTSQAYFNHAGDSASFRMDSSSVNGTYATNLFGIYEMKNFTLSNSQIYNSSLSEYKFLDLIIHKSASIVKTTLLNARGSIPIEIFVPNGEVNFDDVTISGSDVSSYIMYIHSNKLNCTNLKLIQNKAGFGNYYYCKNALFKNCLINDFQGQDVINTTYVPIVTFDNCIIKRVSQTEWLFKSDSILTVTNCSILGISKTVNNPGSPLIFNVWKGMTVYAANNVIDNAFTSGNLIDNAGDMFIANCEFKNLAISNLKSVFNNNGKLNIYNSNINSFYNIPFLNDTSYYGKTDIDFSLVNSIVYTKQDTVVKNTINSTNPPFTISNNISNKSIVGINSVSNCSIEYDNLYDDAYSIIYNKGFTPFGISQYPLIDLFGMPRIVNGMVDIGVKEYQLSTTLFAGSKSSSISLYPNPTKQFVHVTSRGDGFISISDLNGKVCFTHKVQTGDNVFDIDVLSANMYVVGVTVNEETTVEKLIVIK